MARIAFFIDALPPGGDASARFGWDLIRSLADQQHEIQVFSTYFEGAALPEEHPRVEILRPFTKWNLFEIHKALPLLIRFRPEVIHLIQPRGAMFTGWMNAMSVMPSLAPLLGGALTVASFFDINEKTLATHRHLLTGVDALTVSNARQKAAIETFLKGRAQPRIEIVPVTISHHPFSSAATPARVTTSPSIDLLNRLRTDHPKTILVPGPIDQHTDAVATFREVAAILHERSDTCAAITGGWGSVPVRLRHAAEEVLFDAHVGDRVVLTGPLDDKEQSEWLRRADCVLVAPLDEARLAFTQHLREAQAMGAAIVMNDTQARLDPIAWRDGENAWVRERSIEAIRAAVLECLDDEETRTRVSRNAAEFSKSQVIDRPGNALSRLYARLRDREHGA